MTIIPPEFWIFYLLTLQVTLGSNDIQIVTLYPTIRDSVLKYIVKYRNHPSILVIGEVYNKNRRLPFSFSKIRRDEILSDILKLKTSKVSQDNDIPTKIVKENANIFANVLVSKFNDPIEESNFSSTWKMQA